MVEVEGCDRLTSACDTPVAEGMSVLTDSPRARKARRTNIQLILSEHDGWCPTCERSGNCALQRIANGLNVPDIPYERKFEETYWPRVPVIRNEAKCIKCMRCIQVCDKIQGMHIWDLAGTGGRTTVGVTGNRSIDATECTYCGQCITHCPTGALTARDDTEQFFRALEDPDIVTVVQVAPAVRTAWAYSF